MEFYTSLDLGAWSFPRQRAELGFYLTAAGSGARRRLSLPAAEHVFNPRPDFLSRELAIAVAHQQPIVGRVLVADMGDDGEPQRPGIELLRGGGATDASAVLLAGPRRDLGRLVGRTAGKLRAELKISGLISASICDICGAIES